MARIDKIYLVFLVIHLLASVLVDIQGLHYVEAVSPSFLRTIFLFGSKSDPLLSNSTKPLFAWFQSFLFLEIIFQVPFFLYASIKLYKDDPPLVLMLIYSVHAATTTFACLWTVVTLRGLELQLLGSYTPFFLIPLYMMFDFGKRIQKKLEVSDNLKKKS